MLCSVIKILKDGSDDVLRVRDLLGQCFHTLQDFYSHSNWVEMGKKDINDLIGIHEVIGQVAKENQSTCTSTGCKRIEKSCVRNPVRNQISSKSFHFSDYLAKVHIICVSISLLRLSE